MVVVVLSFVCLHLSENKVGDMSQWYHVVLVVCCVVLFLSFVCVRDLFLFLHKQRPGNW